MVGLYASIGGALPPPDKNEKRQPSRPAELPFASNV